MLGCHHYNDMNIYKNVALSLLPPSASHLGRPFSLNHAMFFFPFTLLN